MRKAMTLVLAGLVAASLTACGGSGKPAVATKAPDGETKTELKAEESKDNTGSSSISGKTVAFIPKLTGNAFFESANAGAQKYGKSWGINVDYQGSANAAVADQVQVINNAVASGVDALCVSSVDATGLDSALKEATDAGLTVVTWDSDVSDTVRTLMVSQGTPEMLGKMLVDMGVDSLTKRGKDVKADAVKYCWHYSQATVADQNSWQVAGEAYIKENFPNWVNVAPNNYYSEQDAEKAVSIGASILEAKSDKKKKLALLTGFASPMSIKDYCNAGVIEQWGLWDCQVQGAIGCYLGAYLSAGNQVKVGDKIDIPEIGTVEVMPNDCLVEGAATGEVNNGVVLLPERTVFNKDIMNNYDF